MFFNLFRKKRLSPQPPRRKLKLEVKVETVLDQAYSIQYRAFEDDEWQDILTAFAWAKDEWCLQGLLYFNYQKAFEAACEFKNMGYEKICRHNYTMERKYEHEIERIEREKASRYRNVTI